MNLKIFDEIKKLKLKKYLIVYIVSVDLTIYIRLVWFSNTVWSCPCNVSAWLW